MSNWINLVNAASTVVTALASLVMAGFSTTIFALERGRDRREQPNLTFWFNGFDTRTREAEIVFFNSGRTAACFRQITLESGTLTVKTFGPRGYKPRIDIALRELRDVTFRPNEPVSFYFSHVDGSTGQTIGILFQKYDGTLCRINTQTGFLGPYPVPFEK